MNLNDKQKRFVDEYLVDLNATKAAERAGYSKKTGYSHGQRLLKNVEIQKAIEKAQKNLSERTQITQERVLQEYAKIAFFDPKRMFNDDGTLKQISKLDDDVAAVIGGIDVVVSYSGSGENKKPDYTKKIKMIDKKGALDSIARHLGMFVDNVNLNHKGIPAPERPVLSKEEWLRAHGMESTKR